ncbi:MAG: B12-binding domain-containing radical SAM protein [Candidatus Eisenbacteria bacterium]
MPEGSAAGRLPHVRSRSALLIHPWIADFAAYDFWIQPLGLLFVGGFLRSRGWDVRLLDALAGSREEQRARWDGTAPFASTETPLPAAGILPETPSAHRRTFRRYGVPPEEFERRAAAAPPAGIVLVTLQMTYWYPALEETLALLARTHPEAPIILGGGYAALLPHHAAARPGVDAIVSHRLPQQVLPRLCALIGEPPPLPEEIDRLTADWDLCETLPHAAILTSFGCPFRCPYCATSGTFGAWRPRSQEALLAEVRSLASRPGLQHLACYDDALLHRSAEHFLPLVARLAREGWGAPRFRWHFPNALHARWLDRHVAAALRALGTETVWLGVESCDPAFQARTGGKVRMRHVERAVQALESERARPRHLGAYLLAGVPGLRPETVVQSMERLHGLGIHIALAAFSPIPGTPLFGSMVGREPRLILEPLWQNNTLRQMADGNTWERLREYARALNGRLESSSPGDADRDTRRIDWVPPAKSRERAAR